MCKSVGADGTWKIGQAKLLGKHITHKPPRASDQGDTPWPLQQCNSHVLAFCSAMSKVIWVALNSYGLESQLRANDVCMEQRRNARDPEITRRPKASPRRPGTKIRVIPAESHTKSPNAENRSAEAKEAVLYLDPTPSLVGSSVVTLLPTLPSYISCTEFSGAFCKYCVLFCPCDDGDGSHEAPSSLVSKHFNRWKDALQTFEKHARTKYHGNSQIAAKNVLEIFDCKQADVSELLSQKIKTDAEQNRKIISAIVETLLFFRRPEISLGGHRNSGRLTIEEHTNNDGNFRALLCLRARAGDSLLNEHLNSGRGNAMYISPTVQNELLNLIGKQIQKTFVERIKNAKFFTVLGYETIDISRVEKFFLCVRYVDIDIVDIRDDFLTFVPVYDVTGAGISTTNKTELCQTYMAKSHAAKSDVIRNCFFTISEVAIFFRGSAQRTKILKDGLEAAGIPNFAIHNHNDTQWVERHDCVTVFSESFLSIFQASELLIERGLGDLTARTKAPDLRSNLCSFEFIFLQQGNVVLFTAMTNIEHVERMPSEIRENCDKEFAVVYRNAQGKASKRFRNNVEASTPEEYYRRVVFIPYLDEILMHLKDKFSKHKHILLSLECLLPQNAVRKQFIDIEKAMEFYKDDLKDNNRYILEAEWRLWKMSCRTPEHQTQAKEVMTVCEVLKIIDKDSFPNMAILRTILAVSPVTTASIERSFSTLKRLKTCLRNKTGDERLIALTLMTVHRDAEFYGIYNVENICAAYGLRCFLSVIRSPLKVGLKHMFGPRTVAERLACSPPTKANRVQSPAKSPPYFRMWESCRTMPLVDEFSRDNLLFPPPFHSSAAPYSPHSHSSLLRAAQISSLSYALKHIFTAKFYK
ncbi:hypothetical protein PR048_011594 [Dryococelus australis]|uniref:HAT C-terminal dimerisation domain-containing protein n=1 Tax=Dryococelus australis TaxID=614101 RepID=A0ABQ9HMC2_9NEOP|nr:hypothetical protein PR048_011594 [Dryococelus australis]